MEKYSDAIFYVDNGLYFTKQDIDIIYNLKEPDVEWIYKNSKVKISPPHPYSTHSFYF